MIRVPSKKSKEVLEFATIAPYVRMMNKMLREYVSPTGKKSDQHYALHHSQIARDPFNFFVVNPNLFNNEGNEIMVVVNPRIIEKIDGTRSKVRECCMSFPFRSSIEVNRYGKVKVAYQVPAADGKSMIRKEEIIQGLMAQIFQHEVQHANGSHIYVGTNSH